MRRAVGWKIGLGVSLGADGLAGIVVNTVSCGTAPTPFIVQGPGQFGNEAPTLWPGLSFGYSSTVGHTYNPNQSKTAVNGFIYIGGDLNSSGGGGGNTRIYGSLFVKGDVSLTGNSSMTIYYSVDAAMAVKTTRLNLKQASWQTVLHPWPNTL